jgi:hypothetical protein
VLAEDGVVLRYDSSMGTTRITNNNNQRNLAFTSTELRSGLWGRWVCQRASSSLSTERDSAPADSDSLVYLRA